MRRKFIAHVVFHAFQLPLFYRDIRWLLKRVLCHVMITIQPYHIASWLEIPFFERYFRYYVF